MLRRSYLSTTITVLGISSRSSRIESNLLEARQKPHGWDDLDSVDKKNIRQFLKRRHRQGTEEPQLRHELKTLVTVATMDVDGSLTTADITQFGTVATRSTRALPQFLAFTGSEAPICPKCRNREYEPVEEHPNKMRCKECSFLYTDYELVSMICR